MEGKNVARSCFQPDTVTSSVLQVPVPNGRMPKQMPSLRRLRRYPLFLQCSVGALSNQFVVSHKDVCQQCASLLTVVVALSCIVFLHGGFERVSTLAVQVVAKRHPKSVICHWFSLPMCHCSLGKWLELNLILPQLWLLFFSAHATNPGGQHDDLPVAESDEFVPGAVGVGSVLGAPSPLPSSCALRFPFLTFACQVQLREDRRATLNTNVRERYKPAKLWLQT